MAFGTIQGIANIFRQKGANKALEKLLGQDVRRQQDPFARKQLETAQNAYADPSMGTRGQFQRNIFSKTGNFLDFVNSNATDSSQALALGAAGEGQANEAISNENMGFMQNKMAALQNLNQGYSAMTNEGDMDYQDLIRRYHNLAGIRGQQQQNKTNALNGVFNGLNSDINQALQIAGLFTGNPFAAKGAASSVIGGAAAGSK